ncbi:hypothetical protein F5Y17DRAFT_461775 [Xylariaceae sp. FL0594]|nr:hypothetical protein F5Y17DRAFT_461775 [Xylariaceae sp. FL0594]
MQTGDVLMSYSPMSDATSATPSSPGQSPVRRQYQDGQQAHTQDTAMLDSQYSQEVQSSRACEKCRASKRKCDKKIPSCDRCLRLKAKCCYAPDTGVNNSYAQGARVVFLQQSHSLASDVLFRSADPLEGISAEQILSLVQLDSCLSGPERDYHPSIALFFRFIHPWYAVVHPTPFYRHLEGLRATAELSVSPTDLASPPLSYCTADFRDTDQKKQFCNSLAPKELALLVVLMNLSIRMRLTDAGEQNMFDETYCTVKRLLAMLLMSCADGPRPSIEVLQCGALLALYEYGHGDITTAYQTLSQTVAAARTLGISSSQKSEEGSLTLLEEQRNCLWWGLFILEQFILQDEAMRHLPFILESPDSTTLLPESPPLIGIFPPPTTSHPMPTLASPPTRLPASSLLTTDVQIGSQSLGPFQLSAKTASLFHKALKIDKERRKHGGGAASVVPLSANLAVSRLDMEIRATTKTLLAQSLDWETKLDCFAMMVSSLFVLYTPSLQVLESATAAQVRNDEDLSTALMALRFACRMSSEISCKINASFSPDAPYPAVLCAPAGATCYLVILAYSSLGHIFPEERDECQKAIAEKFESLLLFSFRWGLAEKMMRKLKQRIGLDREYYLKGTPITPPRGRTTTTTTHLMEQYQYHNYNNDR